MNTSRGFLDADFRAVTGCGMALDGSISSMAGRGMKKYWQALKLFGVIPP
jgi:uncharacterized protein YigE (DUF2233 family)